MIESERAQDADVCGEPYEGEAGPKLSPDPGCGRLKDHEGPHLIRAVFDAGRSPRSWEWGAGVDRYEEGVRVRGRIDGESGGVSVANAATEPTTRPPGAPTYFAGPGGELLRKGADGSVGPPPYCWPDEGAPSHLVGRACRACTKGLAFAAAKGEDGLWRCSCGAEVDLPAPDADPEARARAILRADLDRPVAKKGGDR